MHGHICNLEGKIYTALYRKWRPQTFEEVKGQEHITKTLANAVKTNKIAHAYLFVGPRGVGKTSVARIFAKTLNCEKGPTPTPCNVCTNCVKITKGISLDVLEIDGASNRGIDQIRELKERIKFSPVEGRYKIYIIDEVHMLTNEAFNALLKTLEEPPPHVIFIFATTDPQKLPPTILSRCQRFDFKKLPSNIISEEIGYILNSESVEFEKEAIALVSRVADGSMRDALSILEQVIAYSEGYISYEKTLEVLGIAGDELIYEILLARKEGREEDIINHIDKALSRGVDIYSLYRGIIEMVRNLILFKIAGENLLKDLNITYINHLKGLSNIYEKDEIEEILERFIYYENQIKSTTLPRIVLEFLLLYGLDIKESAPSENLKESKRQEESKEVELQKNLEAIKVENKKEDIKVENFKNDDSIDENPSEKLSSYEIWNRFLESIESKVLESSLKDNVKSYKIENGKIILDVPQEMVFYLEGKKQIIKKYFKNILKKDVQLIFNQISNDVVDNHDLLKEALSIFGGRIIKEKDNQQEV